MQRKNNRSSSGAAEAATVASTNNEHGSSELLHPQAKPQEPQMSNSFLIFINLGMVLAGTLTTVFGKILDQRVIMPKETTAGEIEMVETEFKHPLIMNLLMFSGEAILLLMLSIQLSKDPIAAAQHKKNRLNPLVFSAPAFLDVVGSFLNFSGLALISASTYQIMKMLCMPFVVLLSITVMRKRYLIVQYMAVLVVIAGLLVVSLVDINNAKEVTDTSNPNQALIKHHSEQRQVIVGMLALLGGQFFHASHAILEEHILSRGGGQQALYLMGWEGIFGICITLMILLPAQLLTCPFDDLQCVNGHIDDIFFASKQAWNSPIIILFCLCFLLASALFNGFAVNVTKHASATNRVVMDQTRVVLIWAFFLAYPGVGHETFAVGKLAGFLMIVLGVAMFNKIIKVDCCSKPVDELEASTTETASLESKPAKNLEKESTSGFSAQLASTSAAAAADQEYLQTSLQQNARIALSYQESEEEEEEVKLLADTRNL